MTYITVEAAVQDVFQALDQFSSSGVTLGDYRVLDEVQTTCIVLVPGTFSPGETESQSRYREWEVLADLFYCYRDDGTSWTNFATARDNVIAAIENYPTLDSTTGIIMTRIGAAGEPAEVYDKDERGPFFITQRLSITVVERAGITGGEFA